MSKWSLYICPYLKQIWDANKAHQQKLGGWSANLAVRTELTGQFVGQFRKLIPQWSHDCLEAVVSEVSQVTLISAQGLESAPMSLLQLQENPPCPSFSLLPSAGLPHPAAAVVVWAELRPLTFLCFHFVFYWLTLDSNTRHNWCWTQAWSTNMR